MEVLFIGQFGIDDFTSLDPIVLKAEQFKNFYQLTTFEVISARCVFEYLNPCRLEAFIFNRFQKGTKRYLGHRLYIRSGYIVNIFGLQRISINFDKTPDYAKSSTVLRIDSNG